MSRYAHEFTLPSGDALLPEPVCQHCGEHSRGGQSPLCVSRQGRHDAFVASMLGPVLLSDRPGAYEPRAVAMHAVKYADAVMAELAKEKS